MRHIVLITAFAIGIGLFCNLVGNMITILAQSEAQRRDEEGISKPIPGLAAIIQVRAQHVCVRSTHYGGVTNVTPNRDQLRQACFSSALVWELLLGRT